MSVKCLSFYWGLLKLPSTTLKFLEYKFCISYVKSSYLFDTVVDEILFMFVLLIATV